MAFGRTWQSPFCEQPLCTSVYEDLNISCTMDCSAVVAAEDPATSARAAPGDNGNETVECFKRVRKERLMELRKKNTSVVHEEGRTVPLQSLIRAAGDARVRQPARHRTTGSARQSDHGLKALLRGAAQLSGQQVASTGKSIASPTPSLEAEVASEGKPAPSRAASLQNAQPDGIESLEVKEVYGRVISAAKEAEAADLLGLLEGEKASIEKEMSAVEFDIPGAIIASPWVRGGPPVPSLLPEHFVDSIQKATSAPAVIRDDEQSTEESALAMTISGIFDEVSNPPEERRSLPEVCREVSSGDVLDVSNLPEVSREVRSGESLDYKETFKPQLIVQERDERDGEAMEDAGKCGKATDEALRTPEKLKYMSPCTSEKASPSMSLPLAKDRTPEADENGGWGVGRIRVLIALGVCQEEEEWQRRDSREKMELWCRLCNIDDVHVVEVPQTAASSRLLADALTALGAKCQPGDTCVLFLTRLELSSRSGGDVQTMASRQLFLSTLPTHLTVVCISDSAEALESIGLGASALEATWEKNWRAIVMSSTFQELPASRRGQLFVDALMQSKSSLSLLDGPCGLTCSNFFEELTEQAEDVAIAAGVKPPSSSIHSHPSGNIAKDVRWPVAAVPRNGARKLLSPRSAAATHRNTVSIPVIARVEKGAEKEERPRFNLSKVVACTESRTLMVSRASGEENTQTAHRLPGESPSAARSRKKNREGSSTPVRKRKSRSHSVRNQSANMPGNIDQFSAMFSGGLLDKAAREKR